MFDDGEFPFGLLHMKCNALRVSLVARGGYSLIKVTGGRRRSDTKGFT